MKTKQVRKKKNLKAKTKPIYENDNLSYVIIAAEAAEDKKGQNILLLDVSKLTIISDYFLIVSAQSSSQIEAIAKHIEDTLSKSNQELVSKEGLLESNWIVMDYGNMVIHIMHEKERDYYKLENFWSNGKVVSKNSWQKAS